MPTEFKQTIFYLQSEWDDDQKTMKAQQKEFIKKITTENPGAKITFFGYRQIPGGVKVNIDNPIEDAGNKTAFRLESKEKQFYLRFGYLLEYIAKNILPKIKIGEIHDDNPSIFKIDYGDWTNHMYSLPNQISLDPKVCLVRNDQFNIGYANTQIFHTLSLFRESDNGESDASANAAYPMNIYLNFNFILECLKSDDRGDVNLFEFILSICTGLNKALGGINNLEPIINEETNTLQIIDTTPIPGYSNRLNTQPYTLQLYGYNNIRSNYISNFVRNINLKTVIDPGFATMITVGATAGGYIKGTEATAFSKWNFGLIDRYKEEFTPGNISSVKKPSENDEAEVNYATEFITNGYVSRYGVTGLTENFNLSPDAIERNLSIVTEYYKYIIAKESIDQTTSGGTIGFIPFKLGITLDGISGIKIYNKLEVNTEFLPKAYGKTVDLIVTGVSHTLSNNDWETQIETTVIPRTGKQSVITIPSLIPKTPTNNNNSISPGGSNIIQGQPVIDILFKFMDKAAIPKTPENIKFIKAWKQAETTKAKNSLFGSTQKYNNSTKFNGANVQNYNSIEDSIIAHTKTISNKYYPNLYKDLKAGKKTALQIAQDNLKELKTWGTGALLITVLTGGVKDKNLKIYY